MIDTTQTKAVATQTTTSNGELMSSIESEIADLASRASDLQRTIGAWNNWYTAALVLTLLAAGAVLVTNRRVIVLQAKLANVQDVLLRAKDQQLRAELHDKDEKLAKELSDKDVEIGKANAVAAAAIAQIRTLPYLSSVMSVMSVTLFLQEYSVKHKLRKVAHPRETS